MGAGDYCGGGSSMCNSMNNRSRLTIFNGRAARKADLANILKAVVLCRIQLRRIGRKDRRNCEVKEEESCSDYAIKWLILLEL